MKTLIKNGRVVTAVDDYYGDILVEGEFITLIGKNLEVEADKLIDARDKLVIPGGIDAHTHLDMPFGGTTSADDFRTGTLAAAHGGTAAADDFRTGTLAAAHGGTTTIIDFAIQAKGQSIMAALDTWHKKADGKASIDYGFHMIATDLSQPEHLSEMKR